MIVDLPEVAGRFLWHSNYYDGPISGAMVTAAGQRMWFHQHPESEEDWQRTYWYLLYDLTPEEWAWEDAEHERFRELVGTHCDYDENGRRDLRAVQSMESARRFYEGRDWDDVRSRKESYHERSAVALWDPRNARSWVPDEYEEDE